jgi:hypothetical protein
MASDRQVAVPGEKITISDVKHRAEAVRDLAKVEAKEGAEKILNDSAGRSLLMVAGIVVVAASIAFYLGSRACVRVIED